MIKYEVRVYEDGTKFWFLKDNRHRVDGPAIEWASGTKEWYLNGKRHREDGPAIEYTDGDESWYLKGEYLTEEEHKAKTIPTVEMTMEEICEALGKNVKVKQRD